MTFDVAANARQLARELHEKGYEDAVICVVAAFRDDALKWLVEIGGKSLATFDIVNKYYTGDCPLEAYEAAEKAIAALPHKDAEARAKLREEAKELAKRIEALGMTWEGAVNEE